MYIYLYIYIVNFRVFPFKRGGQIICHTYVWAPWLPEGFAQLRSLESEAVFGMGSLKGHQGKNRGHYIHRENGGTLGMVPLIINPVYTLYSEYLLGNIPFYPF